jgi:hypothetical protein
MAKDLGLLQFRSASSLKEEEQEQQMMAEQERRRELVESSLGAHIRRAWEGARAAKEDVHERLLDCLRRRKGEYSAEKRAAIRKEGGSEVFMMITTTKCRAAAAWIRDILMPTNERPWGLDPTPIADVPDAYLRPLADQIQAQAQQLREQGQQVDMEEIVEKSREKLRQAAQDRAKKAAEKHEELIDDQLAEGGWEDALEGFVEDFVTYPAAFIRAPVLRRVPTLEWLEGWRPVKGSTIRPEFVRVSPFDLYPSPDSTGVDDGSFLIERARFTRAQLTQMIGVPGYDEKSIREVLKDYGQGGLRNWLWGDSERDRLEGRDHEWMTPGETIDGLIYWGSAQGTTLLQWGMSPDEIDDPLGEYEIEAILIGEYVIRAKINRDPLERRPHNKASFQPVPGSFWGTGIPELMGDIQDVCNATARGLVNNLAISSGPQVEAYVDRLDPMEDVDDIFPWKVWRTRDSNLASNNRALNFYQPTSNAAELLSVYEAFEQKADDATNIPRYVYGNQDVSGAGETAQGLSMLMESANKGIKDAIRHIDRGVIRRVIEGLWLHNMQYNDDESIKGDVAVVPRGSSAMLIREQTQQLRNDFLQMTANDYDMQILGQEGRRRLLDSIAERLDMPDLLPTKEQMEQQSAQQSQVEQARQKLQIAKEQAEVAERESRAEKYGADAQGVQANMQKTQAEAQHTRAETQRLEEMAPAELQKLIAEIAEILAKIQGDFDGQRGETLEGASSNLPEPGRQNLPRGFAGAPGAGPGQARGLTEPSRAVSPARAG